MRLPTTFRALLAGTLLTLALALPAEPAHANAKDDQIIHDCETSPTGALRGSYEKDELRHALNNLPGDVVEYSGCPDAIRHAIRQLSGGGEGSGGTGGTGGSGTTGGVGGGSTDGTGGSGDLAAGGAPGAPATPAYRGTEAPVPVAGTPLKPGALPSIGRDAHELPTALIALLALLGLATLAPAATTIGRRVVARRRA